MACGACALFVEVRVCSGGHESLDIGTGSIYVQSGFLLNALGSLRARVLGGSLLNCSTALKQPGGRWREQRENSPHPKVHGCRIDSFLRHSVGFRLMGSRSMCICLTACNELPQAIFLEPPTQFHWPIHANIRTQQCIECATNPQSTLPPHRSGKCPNLRSIGSWLGKFTMCH